MLKCNGPTDCVRVIGLSRIFGRSECSRTCPIQSHDFIQETWNSKKSAIVSSLLQWKLCTLSPVPATRDYDFIYGDVRCSSESGYCVRAVRHSSESGCWVRAVRHSSESGCCVRAVRYSSESGCCVRAVCVLCSIAVSPGAGCVLCSMAVSPGAGCVLCSIAVSPADLRVTWHQYK